jgi:isoprenylcysteine carboxyl methyltransferase (ICMT) family protein YpbQ
MQLLALIVFTLALMQRPTWIGYCTVAVLVLDILNTTLLGSLDSAWTVPVLALLPSGSEVYSVAYFVAQWPLTLILILCTLVVVAVIWPSANVAPDGI